MKFLLSDKVENLEKTADDKEQYSHSNYLLIHRLNERKTEDTAKIVLDVISNRSNIEMCQVSIERSHRLGKRNGPGQKPQAIIVKFTRYNDRHHVFGNRNF